MNKDGLKKIFLIKSAGYEFVEIDIANNTLLLGESGVGKTTLMRAVLFFYTMDYSDSMLNLTSETKKSFNDWYFKEHNSHIVYHYTKDENDYLFVVSKTSKLHYTFIDITNLDINVRDIFIDKNRPVNFERLNENIQKYAIPSYTTTIKDRYINLFHKRDEFGKKIKTESPIDFSLFEDIKSRKEFARTLSNIFASSSIKSTNIKKTIVSLIDNATAKIALYDIKMNLNKFSIEKKEIEKFEKKIPIVEELSSEFLSYKENKQKFTLVSNQIEYIQKHSVYQIQEIDTKREALKRERNEQTQKYLIREKMLTEEIASKKTSLDIETSKLGELMKRDEDFKRKNISKILKEYNHEQIYKDEKSVLEKRYEALTSNVREIEKRYEKIVLQLKQNSSENRQKLEKELGARVSAKNENINQLIRDKETKIFHATNALSLEKTDLEQKIEELNKQLNTLNRKQGQLENFPFNKEKISENEENIKSYATKLLDIELAINTNVISINEVHKDINDIKLSLTNNMRTLNDNYTKAKDILLQQKQDIEKKLDFDSQNLYGYLNKNDVKNREKIVTYLKDEILFEEKVFKVNYTNDENSIFGLNVEFEDEFSNEYNQETLLQNLNLLKTNIKELNKKTQKEKHFLEDTASKQTKERNIQRTILYKEKEELEATKKAYIKNRDQLNINLNEAKKEARELRNDEVKRVNEQLIFVTESMKNSSQKINHLVETIKLETASINNFINDEVHKLQAQITELNTAYETEIKELNTKRIIEEKRYEDEKLEALKSEGVDKKVLDTLVFEQKEIESKLKYIETHKKYVILYNEIKDELEKIPFKQEELRHQESEYKNISNRLKSLQFEYKNSDEKLYKTLKELEKQNDNFYVFIKKYEQKIKNQKIQQSMKKTVLLDFKMDINSIQIDTIDTLLTIFESIKSNESEIKSLVVRSLKDLKVDNIFKIDIPTDYLEDIEYTKTARELVEYIKKDKLTPLKDALSEQFKGEIRKITKELDIFDDALLDIQYQIKSLGNTMRKAVDSFNVIDSIEIKSEETNNNLLHHLKSLAEFYDKNSDNFLNGLFDINSQDTKKIKNELDNKIVELVELLNVSKEYLELEDGFVLEFKIVEKGNNLKWRQNIDDIGSNGTSTLVKSIINISMLQMVSKNIVKNSQLLSHCVLDEIGTISTDYFKELKEFVNRSGFVFLNGMPIEDDMLISMYPTIYVGQNYGSYSKMILASKMEI